MLLYHVSPRSTERGIGASGLQPALSRGRLRAVWLCTPGRLRWALLHVAHARGLSARQLLVYRVHVPRGWLTRRRRGVYTCGRPVPPDRVSGARVPAYLWR